LLLVSLAKSALKLKGSHFWQNNILHAVEQVSNLAFSLKHFQPMG